jgi:hypothetical protein
VDELRQKMSAFPSPLKSPTMAGSHGGATVVTVRPLYVVPFMIQIELRPEATLRQRMSALPSPLKSAELIGRQLRSGMVAARTAAE